MEKENTGKFGKSIAVRQHTFCLSVLSYHMTFLTLQYQFIKYFSTNLEYQAVFQHFLCCTIMLSIPCHIYRTQQMFQGGKTFAVFQPTTKVFPLESFAVYSTRWPRPDAPQMFSSKQCVLCTTAKVFPLKTFAIYSA